MRNLHTKIGIFAASALVAAIATYLYSPTIGSRAAESQQAEVSLTVGSVLGIRTSADNLNLEASVGSFVSGLINIDVTTNSEYGYTLTLENSDNESSLIHTNASIPNKLTSLFAGIKTSSQMDDNTWGFSLDSSNFAFIPTLGNPVSLSRRFEPMTAEFETIPVTFGAKVGMTLPSGTYTDTVKFTAYTNGDDIEHLVQIGDITGERTTMQGFFCLDLDIGDTAVLTDIRDGNVYTVKRLRDGGCWMTENLRLGGNKPMTLTSSDTDIDGSFELPAAITTLQNSDFSANDVANVYIDPVYGGYYNYYTAAVGKNDENDSICPKGWTLPSSNAFGRLYEFYSSPELLMGEPNLQYGGFISYGTIAGNGQGSYARYWSLTETNNEYAKSLYMSNNDVLTGNSYPKRYGHTVRCKAVFEASE